MKQEKRIRCETFHFIAVLETLSQIPKDIQKLADKNFKLLKADPRYPSLHFKKIGDKKQLWSVRIGLHYRALGIDKPEGIVWFWIGTHAEYDRLLS